MWYSFFLRELDTILGYKTINDCESMQSTNVHLLIYLLTNNYYIQGTGVYKLLLSLATWHLSKLDVSKGTYVSTCRQ